MEMETEWNESNTIPSITYKTSKYGPAKDSAFEVLDGLKIGKIVYLDTKLPDLENHKNKDYLKYRRMIMVIIRNLAPRSFLIRARGSRIYVQRISSTEDNSRKPKKVELDNDGIGLGDSN